MRIYSGNIIVIGAYLSRAPIRGNTVYLSEKIMKIKNSLLAIFDKIWLMTKGYSLGSLAGFWSNFKNS